MKNEISFGVSDIDAKGEHGGTKYFVNTPDGQVHFNITDTIEAVHPQAVEAWKIVRTALVSSN